MYVVCDLSEPHIVRALIESDGTDLPEGFLHIEGTANIGDQWNGSAFQTYTAPPPSPVTAAQAKLALYGAGILDTVTTAANSNPAFKIYFENATEWHRSNQYVNGLASQLGLTSAQVDDLFRTASTL